MCGSHFYKTMLHTKCLKPVIAQCSSSHLRRYALCSCISGDIKGVRVKINAVLSGQRAHPYFVLVRCHTSAAYTPASGIPWKVPYLLSKPMNVMLTALGRRRGGGGARVARGGDRAGGESGVGGEEAGTEEGGGAAAKTDIRYR